MPRWLKSVANDVATESWSLVDQHERPAVARPVSLLAFPQRIETHGDRAVLPDVSFGRAAPLKPADANSVTAAAAEPVAVDAAPTVAARINPTNRDLRFIVPVTDGDNYLGEIELTVSPRDELSVQADRMLQLLEPLMRTQPLAVLSAKAGEGRSLRADVLAANGVQLAYDPEKLSLALSIAVPQRETRSFALRTAEGNQTESVRPAAFSGYVTLRAATDVVERGPRTGILAPTADVASAFNFHGVALENEGYLSGAKADPFYRRSGSRLVYDDISRRVRLTAGDTFVQAQRFQASPSILGIGFSRRYAELDPQREVRASGAQSFSVTGTSTIETFVNGRSVERRTVGPGNYTLRDFPLAEGSNQVRLRIEDATGATRVVEFSAYASESLLARGLTEFSFVNGVFSAPTRSGFSYSQQWISSGFVRTGVSEKVTLGANFQATAKVQQAGVQVLWGSPLGLLGFDLAASSTTGVGKGLGAAITYEKLLTGFGDKSTALRGAVEVRSRRFEIPQVAFGPRANELHASVGLVRSFARERYLSFDARYDRDAMVGTSWGVQVGGGIPLSQRLSFLAEAGTRRGTQRETWVRAGLRVRLGDRGQAQVDASSRGEFSAGVNGSGGIGIGAWNADANFSRRTTDASLTASGAIDTNRMTIGAQQDVAWNRAGAVTDARTTLRTAFSLAFADGTFALGRPIGEAFVIVKPHRSLRGAPIYLDPQGDGEFARSGALGPALDGALSAHTYRTLAYQVPGAPAGYDLGAGALSLRAPWRGGYKVTIGSDYHLMAVGTLLDKRGDPVKLVSAKAYDLGNRQHPAVLLFTSRSGRFGVQGLRPGRWRIEALTEPAMHYEVNLTDSPDGIARVGPLRPTPVMEQKQ